MLLKKYFLVVSIIFGFGLVITCFSMLFCNISMLLWPMLFGIFFIVQIILVLKSFKLVTLKNRKLKFGLILTLANDLFLIILLVSFINSLLIKST